METGERAPLHAHCDATVIRGAGLAEVGHLRGVYDFVCIRPKRGTEARYAPLFQRRSVLMNKLADASLNPDELDELCDIRREMDAMSYVAWTDKAVNTVCTEGKNLALDTFLAGAAYTVVGPFLGLISSVSYTATAAGDTAAQINGTNGWKEAGTTNAPQWTTPASGARASTNAGWSAAAAGAKALAAAKSFSISTAGTLKGAFLVYGTGAVATNADVNGKLMSAGLFSGGDKTVANLDTVNVSYSLAF